MLGDSMRRRRKASESEPVRLERRTGGLSLGRWLLLAVGILVVSFGVGYLLSTQFLFPRPETAGTGIPVPDLTGEDRTMAETVLREAGLEIGEVTRLAHGDADSGRVLAQTPVAGQQLREGAAVSFAVSAGPAEPRIPPVAGLSAGTARELLERAGFTVEVKQTRSPGVPAGVVDRTDPPAGAPRPLPSTVTMIVSAETVSPADSGPPSADTTGQP